VRFPFGQKKQFVIPLQEPTLGACRRIHKYYYRYFTNNKALSRIIYYVIPDSDRESRYVFNIGPQIINHDNTFISAHNCVSAEMCVSLRENLRRAA
jgi:hypothetical protein